MVGSFLCSCFAPRVLDGPVRPMTKPQAAPALPTTTKPCTPLKEAMPSLLAAEKIGAAAAPPADAAATDAPPAAEAAAAGQELQPPAAEPQEPSADGSEAEDVRPQAAVIQPAAAPEHEEEEVSSAPCPAPPPDAGEAALPPAGGRVSPTNAARASPQGRASPKSASRASPSGGSSRATPRSGGRASPGSPSSSAASRPASRPPLPSELADALADLASPHPADAIGDMSVIRTCAAHDPASLDLASLVPLLVRNMRAPRLGTARAAILTLKQLFAACGDALADYAADDSTPTTSAVLLLLQKATAGDLNSRRIAADADACLIEMVQALAPRNTIAMLQNVVLGKQGHGPMLRAKGGQVLVAAAYKLAATSPADFDLEAATSLLRLFEVLLGSDVACRPAAEKLAAVCRCAWGERAHPDGREGEVGWAVLLRLTVEPATAAALESMLASYGGPDGEMVGPAGLPAWAEAHPLGEVVTLLVGGR